MKNAEGRRKRINKKRPTTRHISFHSGWALAVGGMIGGGIYTLAGVILGVAGPLAWVSLLLGSNPMLPAALWPATANAFSFCLMSTSAPTKEAAPTVTRAYASPTAITAAANPFP